jgi:hypothetical protein
LTDDSTVDKLGIHLKDVEDKFINMILKQNSEHGVDDQHIKEVKEQSYQSAVDFKNPHIFLQTKNK